MLEDELSPEVKAMEVEVKWIEGTIGRWSKKVFLKKSPKEIGFDEAVKYAKSWEQVKPNRI